MGCYCSEPSKEDMSLLAEAQHQTKKQNTERRPNETPAESNEKGMNGYHPITAPSASWYIEPEHKMSENILEALGSIIDEVHKNDIQDAIKKVKIKDDLNEVCQYLIDKETSSEIKLNQVKHECKQIVTACDSMNRLITVFKTYIGWIKEAESAKPEESLYAIVEDNLQILNDYHHLMLHHNTDREFEMIYALLLHKKLIISIDESSIILRHYRDKSVMMNKERKRLYFGYQESNEVCIIKLVDRIYCHFAYAFVIGIRWKLTEKVKLIYAAKSGSGDAYDENDILLDSKLVCMSSIMKNKQKNLVNIIGSQRIKTNKFVSQKDHKTAAIFYYKPDKATSNEKMEIEGKEYTQKDWFITPKYGSLKDELMNNDNCRCRMDNKIFDDLIMLSQLYMDGVTHKMHDIKRGRTMDHMHVLAVMTYCNHAAIQYELKQTYFRLTEKETDFAWKKRHRLLAHLGGLLCEIVSSCGSICTETDAFYHSMSIKKVNTTLITLRAATSSTDSMLIALHYSSLGTIIELKGGNTIIDASKYFDCKFISDFAHQNERLFVASETPLELSSISDSIKLESYALFVFAFRIITIAFGEVNEHWSDNKNNPMKVKQVQKLSKRMLEQRAFKCQPHLFGHKKPKKHKNEEQVLYQMVEQFALSKKEMVLFWFSSKTLDIWPWINDLLQFMKSGCFCKTFRDNSTWLKLDLLSLFFPHLESLTIADCPITEYMLTEIDSFIRKLRLDPAQKHKKKEKAPKQLEREESDVFGKMGLDLDNLVQQLHADKSHISFKDPSFDDVCDYRQCKIKEIKILESYDEHDAKHSILNKDKVFKKYNKTFEKSGWSVVKAKIMGNNQGFIIKKI